MLRFPRTALSLFVLGTAALAAVQDPPPIGAPGPAAPPAGPTCWQPAGNTVDLVFNPALAPELENPGNANPPSPSAGVAADRTATVRQAVADWNNALNAVAAPFRINLVVRRVRPPYATHQLIPAPCTDPIHNVPVYGADYRQYRGDTVNAGSTADNNFSGPRHNLGPGWVQGGAVMSHVIDQRLAETTHVGRLPLRESDILWFTHFNEGRQCPQIRWAYPFAPGGPLPAPYYDFYSVMLHEIGHFLGLDHESCPLPQPGKAAIRNVMEDSIAPGTRSQILRCEMISLARLYGRGGPCGAMPPPPRQ